MRGLMISRRYKEVEKLDNDYAEAQDIVVIAISGEIGEVCKD